MVILTNFCLLKNDEKRALNLPNYQKKQLFLGKMQTKFRKYQKNGLQNGQTLCKIHSKRIVRMYNTHIWRDKSMSNRLFQAIVHQMTDAIDRTIGVIDESGTVISCSELGRIGEVLSP